MPEIPLRRRDGTVRAYALISAVDYTADIRARRWHLTNGYVASTTSKFEPGGKREILLHRVLMRAAPGEEVDHRNGNRLDCRRRNLRLVTPDQNKQNLPPHADNPSRARGVSWAPHVQLWRARVHRKGKTYCCGYHSTVKSAASAASTKRGELMTHSEEWRHGS